MIAGTEGATGTTTASLLDIQHILGRKDRGKSRTTKVPSGGLNQVRQIVPPHELTIRSQNNPQAVILKRSKKKMKKKEKKKKKKYNKKKKKKKKKYRKKK